MSQGLSLSAGHAHGSHRARDVQHQLRRGDRRARLLGFPRHLEEAATDLVRRRLDDLLEVTFPLILPGVIAAALLAFSLSIDDYVITAFTAGQTSTFPLYIYGAQQRGIPVQVNVIGTIIFLTAVGFVVFTTVLSRRQRTDPVDAAAIGSRRVMTHTSESEPISRRRGCCSPARPIGRAQVWARYTDLVIDRGEGSWLITTDGDRYLDYTSGIGVTNTGHAHPR